MRPLPVSAWLLGMTAALTAFGASVLTLLWDGPSTAPWGRLLSDLGADTRGWSAITLAVAVPLVLFCLSEPPKHAQHARMVAMGGLVYLAYTYLELAMSPPYSALYLAYVVIFATAIPATVMIGRTLDVDFVPWLLGEEAPRKGIAAFSIAFALLLGSAWLWGIASSLADGVFGALAGEAAMAHVAHTLDLGLVVPLGLATGVLLLRRRPSGDVLAVVTLTFAICMGAALAAMVAWRSAMSGTDLSPALPFTIAWLVPVLLALRLGNTARTTPPRPPLQVVPSVFELRRLARKAG